MNLANNSLNATFSFASPLTYVYGCSVLLSFLSGLPLLTLCVQRILLFDQLSNSLFTYLTSTNVVLLFICIVDFFRSAVYPNAESPCRFSQFCIWISYFRTFINLSAMIWTLVIGACCTMKLRKRLNTTVLTRKWTIVLFGISIGVPTIIVSAALGCNALGVTNTRLDETWCWISTCTDILSPNQQIAWMLITNKFWDFVCYVYIASLLFMGVWLKDKPVKTSTVFPWARLSLQNERASESNSSGFVSSFTSLDAETPEQLDAEKLNQQKRIEKYSLNSRRLFMWIPVVFFITRAGGTIGVLLDFHAILTDHTPERGLRQTSRFFTYYKVMGDPSQNTANLILVLILRSEARAWIWSNVLQLLRSIKTLCDRRTPRARN